MADPYAPASRIATKSPTFNRGSSRSRPTTSLLSQTGPTISYRRVFDRRSVTGSMRWNASYMAGRSRGGRRRAPQRIERRDLRSDVHMNRHALQRAAIRQPVEEIPGFIERHPELVHLQAGGDAWMAPGVDVRIDAHRHARGAAEARRDLFDARELARRFDVDRLDAERDRALELRGRFADAGEHDVGGREACSPRDVDLP